jgi:hypothetical protein
MLTLQRIVRLAWDAAVVDDQFHLGKVYPADSLARYKEGQVQREEVGALPPGEPLAGLGDVALFCDRWITFALGPLAKDLGDPGSIFRPVLRNLRGAVQTMPEAPVPPEDRPVRYLDPIAVANELKRYRDWARAANCPQPEPGGGGQTAEQLPLDGAKFSEEDAPAAFREGGRPTGRVLTATYLKDATEWNLPGPYLSRNYGQGKTLTKHIKVGRARAYLFKEVAALRTIKTANAARREERP